MLTGAGQQPLAEDGRGRRGDEREGGLGEDETDQDESGRRRGGQGRVGLAGADLGHGGVDEVAEHPGDEQTADRSDRVAEDDEGHDVGPRPQEPTDESHDLAGRRDGQAALGVHRRRHEGAGAFLPQGVPTPEGIETLAERGRDRWAERLRDRRLGVAGVPRAHRLQGEVGGQRRQEGATRVTNRHGRTS